MNIIKTSINDSIESSLKLKFGELLSFEYAIILIYISIMPIITIKKARIFLILYYLHLKINQYIFLIRLKCYRRKYFHY